MVASVAILEYIVEGIHSYYAVLKEMVLNEQLKIPSLRELLKITFNKDEWQLQSPFKKWCYLYGIGRSCVNTIGYTAFKDDQSLSWLMPVPFIYIGLYTILAIYTAFYYINKGEPFKCLPCTCLMVGPLFAVSSVFKFQTYSKWFMKSVFFISIFKVTARYDKRSYRSTVRIS